MASLEFLGGAGTVTGSKFLLRVDGEAVLVDCGLFQGLKDLRLKNWQPFPVDPSEITAVVLTHAHLDHTGALPLLVKQGFKGDVFCTKPTKELCRILLLDSAKIQEEDADRANREHYSKHSPAKPLSTVRDAEDALRLLKALPLDTWFSITPKIRIRFSNAGHILGSAFLEIEASGKIYAFSGDMGRSEPLIMNPPAQLKRADYIVMESTYGDRLHTPVSPEKELARIINETVTRGGQIIIPCFAVGRVQDVLYILSGLRKRGEIPTLPVYLDSPMGAAVTEVVSNYTDWHRLTPEIVEEMNQTFTVIKSSQQSQELLLRKEPAIILAGSGMLSGGRVLSHLIRRLPDEQNTVILVGYQAIGTRGYALRSGAQEVKIYGRYIPVRARIEEVDTLSAHADQSEIIRWLGHVNPAPKNTFIVHGDPQASDALRVKIQDTLHWKCVVPKLGQIFEI